jgi:hypothetical protein
VHDISQLEAGAIYVPKIREYQMGVFDARSPGSGSLIIIRRFRHNAEVQVDLKTKKQSLYTKGRS